MLLISLDEGGHFERSSGKMRSMMIGGALFRGSETDMIREANRLLTLYRKVCAEQNASFPEDLHYNWAGGYVYNAESANRVKTALLRELPDFFNGTGSWISSKPNGTYMIYALLGDPNGMASMNQPGLSNLMNDEVCGNRYEHMAYRAVQNLLFYDLSNNETNIRLDLATRVLAVGQDIKLEEEAKTLGLTPLQDDDAKRHLTDAGSFRAMLSQSILDSGRTDIQVDLNVQSILYKESRARANAFLYLADTLCSAYQDAIGTTATCSGAIGKLEACCRQLVGSSFRIWAYHDMDEQYRQAVRSFRDQDYFRSLMAVQQIRHANNAISDFYNRAWLTGIERRTSVQNTPEALKIALIQLEDYLDSHTYNLSDAIAIHKVLKEQWAHTTLDEKKTAELLFGLCKTEMTISNHRGDYTSAIAAYHQCLQYAQYVSVEDYLEIQNMLAVAQYDSQQTDDAINTVQATMMYEKMLLDIKKEIYPDCGNIHIHYGRTCSQMGQYYAFDGQYEKACECFREAISSFGTSEGEAARTRSYYLHALIEAGEQERYEEEACKYFGAKNQLEQYRQIEKLEKTSAKFALYVYMKALYVFYRKTAPSDMLHTVIRSVWENSASKLDHHPWEMILKYCAFIMVSRKLQIKNCSPDELMERAALSVKNDADGILLPIVEQGRLQYEQVKKDVPVFEGTTLTYMYR